MVKILIVFSEMIFFSSAIKIRKLNSSVMFQGDKVLIFSQFTSVMDILEVYLKLRDYQYCRLDGSTPVMERYTGISSCNFRICFAVSLLLSNLPGKM